MELLVGASGAGEQVVTHPFASGDTPGDNPQRLRQKDLGHVVGIVRNDLVETARCRITGRGRALDTLAPMLHDLDQSIADLNEFRDRPAGTIRITTVEHAAKTVLCPALSKILPDHPDITVEIIVDYGLADVVADRFDAGVRLGEQVAKDMIAVRIAPDIAVGDRRIA
jgi:hypothetical protein